MTLYFSSYFYKAALTKQRPPAAAGRATQVPCRVRRLLAGSGGVRAADRRPGMVAVNAVWPLCRCRPRPCCCSFQIHARIATPQDRRRSFTVLPQSEPRPCGSFSAVPPAAAPQGSSPRLPLYACPPTPTSALGYHIASVVLPSLKSTPTLPPTRVTHSYER